MLLENKIVDEKKYKWFERQFIVKSVGRNRTITPHKMIFEEILKLHISHFTNTSPSPLIYWKPYKHNWIFGSYSRGPVVVENLKKIERNQSRFDPPLKQVWAWVQTIYMVVQ